MIEQPFLSLSPILQVPESMTPVGSELVALDHGFYLFGLVN